MKQCCNIDRLALLIEDKLELGESSQLVAHLDHCTSCQDSLETISATRTWWQRAERGLSSATLTDNGLVPDDPGSVATWESLVDQLDSTVDPISHSANGFEPFADAQLDTPVHPELLGRIDEFDIEEKIGQGGMGVVYRGFDRSLNRPVAIKVMAPHLGENENARQRFAREAQAAAAVVHPNVVPIYRVNSTTERPYMAMALVDGPSLQQHVNDNGPLEPIDVVRVSLQVADGLAAAHAQGLIHRDIKPANILMDRDFKSFIITDFGLARSIDEIAMTQSGCLAGTPHYMSPEQVTDAEIDHRSDLFSVGSLMYFLATGQEPFQAESAFAVINKIICDLEAEPIRLNQKIPPTLSRIIELLLEKKPSNRIQSASQLQHLLKKCLAHLQDPENNPAPNLNSTPRERVLRRKRWYLALLWMGLGSMAILGGAAMSGLLSGPENRPGPDEHRGEHSDEHHSGGHAD